MLIVELTGEKQTVAEITPPKSEQWTVLAPFANPGWVSLYLPEKSVFAFPLRPGARHIIHPEYEGRIQACLGCAGMLTPFMGVIVIFNDREEGEVNIQYASEPS